MKGVTALLVASVLLVSCRTMAPRPGPAVADLRLLVESDSPGAVDCVLPQSGVHIRCAPQPVITASDIADIDSVTLELGKALLLQLTPHGAAAMANQERASPGRRLVLVIEGRPVGTVRLDQPVPDARLVMFVEVPESDLPALVSSVRRRLARSPR